MCLCKGSGGIAEQKPWGIMYTPCPDTECVVDREAAKAESKRMREEYLSWIEEVMT